MMIEDTGHPHGFNYGVLVFVTMPPKPNIGKSPEQNRRYRSELRKQQAEQTRERVVASAAELFAAEGYARTTLAKIAAAAGVSTETVQTHGPKAALMVAAVEYVAFGVSGEQNILDLELGRQFLAIDDRQTMRSTSWCRSRPKCTNVAPAWRRR